MKRILVGGFHHESDSFNPIIADEKDFVVAYGNQILENLNDNDSISGIIKTLKAKDYEVVPTVMARAVPNGLVSHEFYNKIKNEFIDRAKKANKENQLDGIVLSLHGSMHIEKQGEAEGYLLEELRELFPQIPLYSALDMHTTMTKRMHDNCDGFVGYKCAPHTDCFETGVHAATMLINHFEKNTKSLSSWVKVPILIAGEQSETSTEPMKELISALRELEKNPKIEAASYLMGFPWCDNSDSSVAVYVVADGDKELADKEAIRLANLMWDRRRNFKFHTETYKQEEVIDKVFEAVNNKETPVYLSDSGDNPTAGSSSDCTDLLRLIIEDDRTDSLKEPVIYGGIYDPIATKECEGKIGSEITLTFGAKFDKITSRPITIKGRVKNYIKGWQYNTMISSDLALFSAGGVDIVIAEKHVGFVTPEMYVDLGRNPQEAEIVVCKLGYLTSPHKKIANKVIMALSKGSTNEDLATLEYKKVVRPIYPIDLDMEYDAEKNLKE